MPGNLRLTIVGLVYGLLQSSAMAFDVSTYHYDALRTGWNEQETVLTPATVKGGGFPIGFRVLNTVPLDERVNAQPLLITNQSISNMGVHDVVYVATANNTVYAIDATTGAVLLTKNFGQPVRGCGPSGTSILGILSTPVIDRQAQLMYFVTETLEDGDVVTTEVDPGYNPKTWDQNFTSVRDRIDPPQLDVHIPFFTGPGHKPIPGPWFLIPRIPLGKHPEYKIHAIDLSTLDDKLPPQVVSASHSLKDGKVYKFSALNSRQRPALVHANGRIYAAFSAACELGDRSRGWLLGWDAATLAPLPSNELTNTLAITIEPHLLPAGSYLSGIWMSGFGVAADASGNLFFATGNSGNNTYDTTYNLSNSVMKVSRDLTLIDYFTPADVYIRDSVDQDFGSGGVLLMPDQTGSKPHLAVAAGKPEIPITSKTPNNLAEIFLLDRDHLGGFAPPAPGNNVLWSGLIGPCLCGPSYFVGSDSTPRIVTSGGNQMIIWKLQTEPAPALVQEYLPVMDLNTSSGFFTTVSSNGLMPGTAVIWAVHSNPPMLSAFDAATGAKINSWPAGSSWRPNLGYPSTVPVVANGKVYVATDRQLAIFGRGGPLLPHPVSKVPPWRPPPLQNPNVVEGEVRALHGSRITIATSAGSQIQVDVSNAISIPFAVGSRITVDGRRDKNGIVHANVITYPELYPQPKK